LHELGPFGMYYNWATLVPCQSSVKYLTDFVNVTLDYNVTPNMLPHSYVIMAKLHLWFL